MRDLLLLLLISGVVYAGLSVGTDWGRQQAFLHFSQQYIEEVDDFAKAWNRQAPYPFARQWLVEFYYSRRWEVINSWAKELIEYNRKMALKSELVGTIEKFVKTKGDFRDAEKVKFYVLELKQLAKRLPKPELGRNSPLFSVVAGKFIVLRSQLAEHKKLVQNITPRLQQLDMIFRSQMSDPSLQHRLPATPHQ
jgi:hypothetical protein